jgi:hypothetical protein
MSSRLFGSRLRFASALTAAVLVTTLGAPAVYAQQLPPSQPPPASAHAPNGEYVAPLSQGTQQVYVPQSVALSGPREIKDYEEGDPIPPGYHAESKIRKGLVIGGSILFGAMYILTVLVGAGINDANGNHSSEGSFLFVPVAGPFLQMTKTDTSLGNVTLAIDGVAQAAGATMFIVGITSPKTVLVRNDLGEVRVAPMRLGQGGAGMGLVGTF